MSSGKFQETSYQCLRLGLRTKYCSAINFCKPISYWAQLSNYEFRIGLRVSDIILTCKITSVDKRFF